MTTLTLYTMTGAEVEVEFSYYAGRPGTFDDPPEHDEIEIDTVEYKGLDVWPLLNDAETENLMRQIEERRGRYD